jgi:hypothetical protein
MRMLKPAISIKFTILQQMQPHIFLMILEYVYTDHLDIHADFAMEVFAAADLFDIPRLQALVSFFSSA